MLEDTTPPKDTLICGFDDIPESKLRHTNDAMVWAKAFVQYKRRNGWTLDQIDEGLMVGWFANAMAAQEFAEMSDGEKSTRRWFPLQSQIDLLVDQIIEGVEQRRKRLAVKPSTDPPQSAYFDKNVDLPEGWRWF